VVVMFGQGEADVQIIEVTASANKPSKGKSTVAESATGASHIVSIKEVAFSVAI